MAPEARINLDTVYVFGSLHVYDSRENAEAAAIAEGFDPSIVRQLTEAEKKLLQGESFVVQAESRA